MPSAALPENDYIARHITPTRLELGVVTERGFQLQDKSAAEPDDKHRGLSVNHLGHWPKLDIMSQLEQVYETTVKHSDTD